MAKIKVNSAIFFAILLSKTLITLGQLPFNQPMSYGSGHDPIQEFLHRLQPLILHDCSVLPFELGLYVLNELAETTTEFQELCLGYYGEDGNPVTALNKAISFIFCLYKVKGDIDILEEIEQGDPVGFNVYLRAKGVYKEDSNFKNHTKIFISTMRDRIRLKKMKYELTNIPQDVRYQVATEHSNLHAGSINYFINLAEIQTNKKMYHIDLVVMDEFNTYTKKNVDDVQIFGATIYNEMNAMIPKWHALCINYKASTGKVHIYDSEYDEYTERLEGRQRGIIQKLYPYCDIKYEKPTALQNHPRTCSIFAITYATLLLLNRDPAKVPIKLNKVYGDETLYMRLHIMEMLSKQTLFLPKKWGFK